MQSEKKNLVPSPAVTARHFIARLSYSRLWVVVPFFFRGLRQGIEMPAVVDGCLHMSSESIFGYHTLCEDIACSLVLVLRAAKHNHA